jgi:antitoxin CcdA
MRVPEEAEMSAVYDPEAPKKPTNLSINSDLLARARSLDMNLSAILERALEENVRQQLRQQWLDENRGAIAAYNAHFEKAQVFSAGLRRF